MTVKRARLLLLCVAVLCGWFAGTLPVPSTVRAAQSKDKKKDPPKDKDCLDLLKQGLKNYERVKHYKCTFYKWERIGKTLRDEQKYLFCFRKEPFSVYMKLLNTSEKGQELLYVEGEYDGKCLCRPGGPLGVVVGLKLDPDDPLLKKRSRHLVTEAGFGNTLKGMIDQFEKARKNGDLQVKYLGEKEVGGRPTWRFKRTLPAGKGYYCGQLVIDLDQKLKLPLRVEVWDFNGRILERHRFEDLDLNSPDLTPKTWKKETYPGLGGLL